MFLFDRFLQVSGRFVRHVLEVFFGLVDQRFGFVAGLSAVTLRLVLFGVGRASLTMRQSRLCSGCLCR